MRSFLFRSAIVACALTTVADATAAACQTSISPYGVTVASPWTDAEKCLSSAPAPLVETGTSATDPSTVATMRTDCCKAAPLCSTQYQISTGSDGSKQTCDADLVVPSDRKCYHHGGDSKCPTTAMGSTFAAKDKEICCAQTCLKGFKLFGATTTEANTCDDGDYQVHTTAACATGTCGASDKATCCQKKCKTGVVLFGEDTSATAVDVACAKEEADAISTTAFCTGATCTTSDTQCCLQKCSDGFELNGGTDSGTSNGGSAKLQCDADLAVSALTAQASGFCAKDKCASSDAKVCCQTKCTAATGFELNGGTTAGKFQCGKDLRVHPTGYCKGTDCKASSSVCCQQKCTAGFKLKGATGTGTECGEGLTVHATAYCTGSSCGSGDAGTCCQQSCSKGWKLNGATTKEANTCAKDTTIASDAKCKGSPCSSTDSTICCNEKCTHPTTGFKVKGGTGKEANECAAGETVSSKGMCKGDCSATDDTATCCLKANNSTATTDATSTGLASVVGMLIVLSATS